MDQKLAMKIYEVMCKTKALEKDMTVGSNNNAYKAISEKTVLNEIKPLFKEHKLIMMPISSTPVEITEKYPDQYDSNKTKLKSLTQITVKFLLVDAETGESVEIEVVGNGSDTMDKGSGKAMTYAYKVALQKTFMMFSGEDTDNHHSDEMTGNDDEQPVITTKQLEDICKDKHVPKQQLLDRYKQQTGKNVTEIKFISQEKKIEYYKMLENM